MLKMTMNFEKATKNTYRYKEIDTETGKEPERPHVFYFNKSALPDCPDQIVVTVETP